MRLSAAIPICLSALVSAPHAQTSPNTAMPVPSPATVAASRVLTRGVVQKVDKASGVVTLKHAAIKNMKIPAATMAFEVGDKKMLEQIRTGDTVHFHVELVNGAPTVTYIKPDRSR